MKCVFRFEMSRFSKSHFSVTRGLIAYRQGPNRTIYTCTGESEIWSEFFHFKDPKLSYSFDSSPATNVFSLLDCHRKLLHQSLNGHTFSCR